MKQIEYKSSLTFNIKIKRTHFKSLRTIHMKDQQHTSCECIIQLRDLKHIIIGTFDEHINCYNNTSLKYINHYIGHRLGTKSLLEITDYPLSSSSMHILIAGGYNSISFYNINTTSLSIEPYYTIPNAHNNWITCLIYNHNKDIIVSASRDKTIRFWKNCIPSSSTNDTVIPIQILSIHNQPVYSLLFLYPHQNILLSGASDQRLRFSAEVSTVFDVVGTIHYKYSFFSSVVQVNEKEIAVNSWSNRVLIYNVDRYELEREINVDAIVVNCICQVKKDLIVVGCKSGKCMVIDIEKKSVVMVIECGDDNYFYETTNIISVNNNENILICGNNNIIYVIDC